MRAAETMICIGDRIGVPRPVTCAKPYSGVLVVQYKKKKYNGVGVTHTTGGLRFQLMEPSLCTRCLHFCRSRFYYGIFRDISQRSPWYISHAFT